MNEFRDCVEKIQVEDINRSGLHYTWNQKRNANNGILKKIDRIMGKEYFLHRYSNASAKLQTYRNSDHSPAFLKIPMIITHQPKILSNLPILFQAGIILE